MGWPYSWDLAVSIWASFRMVASGVDHPGGVVGAVDDDPLHLGGEGGLQGGKVDLEVLQVGGHGGEGAAGTAPRTPYTPGSRGQR